jgi:hypothetical protein
MATAFFSYPCAEGLHASRAALHHAAVVHYRRALISRATAPLHPRVPARCSSASTRPHRGAIGPSRPASESLGTCSSSGPPPPTSLQHHRSAPRRSAMPRDAQRQQGTKSTVQPPTQAPARPPEAFQVRTHPQKFHESFHSGLLPPHPDPRARRERHARSRCPPGMQTGSRLQTVTHREISERRRICSPLPLVDPGSRTYFHRMTHISMFEGSWLERDRLDAARGEMRMHTVRGRRARRRPSTRRAHGGPATVRCMDSPPVPPGSVGGSCRGRWRSVSSSRGAMDAMRGQRGVDKAETTRTAACGRRTCTAVLTALKWSGHVHVGCPTAAM